MKEREFGSWAGRLIDRLISGERRSGEMVGALDPESPDDAGPAVDRLRAMTPPPQHGDPDHDVADMGDAAEQRAEKEPDGTPDDRGRGGR